MTPTEAPPAPRADLPPDYDPSRDEGFEPGPNGQPAGEAVPDSPDPQPQPSPAETPSPEPETTPEPGPGPQPGEEPDETPAAPEADLGDDEPAPVADELALDGDYQLSLTIGGKKPTSSVLKLQGGTISVPKAQFKKGERLRVALDLRIGAVKIEDKIDSDLGTVISTLRTHTARVEGCQRLEDPRGSSEEED